MSFRNGGQDFNIATSRSWTDRMSFNKDDCIGYRKIYTVKYLHEAIPGSSS